MLRMNEVLVCHPSRFGLHEYELKRRTGQWVMRVRGILARDGQTATEIAHTVLAGQCDMLTVERVRA